MHSPAVASKKEVEDVDTPESHENVAQPPPYEQDPSDNPPTKKEECTTLSIGRYDPIKVRLERKEWYKVVIDSDRDQQCSWSTLSGLASGRQLDMQRRRESKSGMPSRD